MQTLLLRIRSHGTAFSLIFEKEFISINERVEKGKKMMNVYYQF